MRKDAIVELPEYGNVPRWLILQGEIDSRLFLLNQMRKADSERKPIDIMIDDATGYDKELMKEAEKLITELRWLKSEFDKEKS